MRELLLCPPDYYGIEYEINPWMSRARGAKTDLAKAQWQGLHKTLASLEAKVELVPPQPKLPDMVFTANAGLTVGKKFIPSNFRHQERAGEAPHFARWMEEHGYEILALPENLYFEGEGDALFGGDAAFLRLQIPQRYSIASRGRGYAWLPRHLGRAGRSAFLPSRHLLLSAARWRCGLVSGGV